MSLSDSEEQSSHRSTLHSINTPSKSGGSVHSSMAHTEEIMQQLTPLIDGSLFFFVFFFGGGGGGGGGGLVFVPIL